jgi:hypothetical protein
MESEAVMRNKYQVINDHKSFGNPVNICNQDNRDYLILNYQIIHIMTFITATSALFETDRGFDERL